MLSTRVLWCFSWLLGWVTLVCEAHPSLTTWFLSGHNFDSPNNVCLEVLFTALWIKFNACVHLFECWDLIMNPGSTFLWKLHHGWSGIGAVFTLVYMLSWWSQSIVWVLHVCDTDYLSLPAVLLPATDVDVTEFGFVINIIMVVVVSLHLAIETLHWVSEREKHHIVTVLMHILLNIAGWSAVYGIFHSCLCMLVSISLVPRFSPQCNWNGVQCYFDIAYCMSQEFI